MKKRNRKIIVVLLTAALLVTAGTLLFNRYVQQKVEEKIRTAIPGETIDFSSVDVSLLHSFININDASLKMKKQPATIYLKKIEISGIHFWKWITNKELIIDSAEIKNGVATYHTDSYQYKIANIHAAGNKNVLHISIDTIRILPLYSKEKFSRRLGHQADRIESTITGLALNGISTPSLFKHELAAKELSVKTVVAYVFRDRRLPRLPDMQPLPSTMIKKIPLPVRLNSLRVLNGTITYEEYPKEGDHTGILKIEHAKLSLTPFITRPLNTDPSYMLLRSGGSLMGSGTVFTSMSIPTRSNNHYVKGAIHDLDLTKLNSGSENLGKIHIESGLLDSLGFEFNFDEKKSTGKIIGIYHRLIIQPLKKNKKTAKLKSFMLRRFIIPLNKDRSLPEKKRTGKIDYTRDPTRKVSFYLLQSLLTGIKASFKLGFLLPK